MIGDIFYKGGPFVLLILLIGLIGLIFVAVTLALMLIISNYSQRAAKPWIILSTVFLLLIVLLGFSGYWNGMSNFKKAAARVGTDSAGDIEAYARLESLIPLKFGILFFTLMGIPFLIALYKFDKLPRQSQAREPETRPSEEAESQEPVEKQTPQPRKIPLFIPGVIAYVLSLIVFWAIIFILHLQARDLLVQV